MRSFNADLVRDFPFVITLNFAEIWQQCYPFWFRDFIEISVTGSLNVSRLRFIDRAMSIYPSQINLRDR